MPGVAATLLVQETAVQTYTQCLEELDAGQLPMWSRLAAPKIAVNYWRLAPDATMRDVIANIRWVSPRARVQCCTRTG